MITTSAWTAGYALVLLVPLLACAAIVLASVGWAVGPASPPDRTGRAPRSAGVILASAAALLLTAAILLVQTPGWSAGRLGVIGPPLMVLLALALATVGGGPFTTAVLALAMRSTAGPNGGIVVGRSDAVDPRDAGSVDAPNRDGEVSGGTREVLRGGTTIGLLERIAAAGAIIAGFPEAIAIIVALKGVGRFTELSTSEAKERFIIGSLASLLWACACTLLVR